MTSSSSCPDGTSLQQLLDGALSESRQTELARHLETCAGCRAALDQFATAGGSLAELARGLHQDAAAPEPGLQRVLASETQGDLGPEQDLDLTFLDPPSRPGQLGRLGHYEVQEIIGKGGFGIVLKAFDEKLHRVVAIKVLLPRIASNGTARKRFTREARAAAAVTHDHVVTIHAVEDEPHPPYIVMQCIAGLSLQEKLDREGPLGLKEILRIGLQTAEGLAAAHKQGLVHRDIKPSNILLENGVERVKITDFGLARAVDDASLSQSGVVAGTPMYMSPEQAEGLAIDHRSDLFSLGTVLYVMCTGRPPFRATGTMAVLKRVIDDTPRPIREINPEIPEWLADLIVQLHAKKPEKRLQSARAVAEVLEQRLAELQAHGRALPAQMPKPLTRRQPWKTALLAGVLLGLVGLAVALWPTAGPGPSIIGPDAKKKDEITPPVGVEPKEPFVILARDARAEQGFSSLADAVDRARSGDTLEIRRNGLFVTSPIAIPPDKPLLIRAGAGFRPVVQVDPTSTLTYLIQSNSPLILEGLELRRSADSVSKICHLVNGLGPFHILHCRLTIEGHGNTVNPTNSWEIEIQNSQLLTTYGSAVGWHPPSKSAFKGRLTLRNNIMIANAAYVGCALSVAHRNGFFPELHMELKNNTLLADVPFGLIFYERPAESEQLPERSVQWKLSNNLTVSQSCYLRIRTLNPEAFPAPEVLSFLQRRFRWDEARQGHGKHASFLKFDDTERGGISNARSIPENAPLLSLDSWQQWWGMPPNGSLQGEVRFSGRDLRAKSKTSPLEITPADFRLGTGSLGQGAGPGGKDLGADVELVGPGPAYERWQKTPEYRRWQKKTEERLHLH